MRHACTLIVVILAGQSASARNDTDPNAILIDVRAFCSAMADASGPTLERAEERIEAIKRDSAAVAELESKRGKVAADTVVARARVTAQRRDVDALRSQLVHLSPAMIEERRLVGADLLAHLEVLDRFRQTEAVLEIELAGIEAEIAARHARTDVAVQAAVAASESELRRCITDRRKRLR